MTEGGRHQVGAGDPPSGHGYGSGAVEPGGDGTGSGDCATGLVGSAERQRRELGQPLDVLGAIALGGVVGAEARYGVGLMLSDDPGGWPWSTLVINVSGCLVIGVLMVVITELLTPHRLVRPFLGVGVLGGYTTFSTVMVETLILLRSGEVLTAVEYAVGTPLLAVLACGLGVVMTRLVVGRAPWLTRIRR